MEKFVTNISDLVMSAMTTGDVIKRKAEEGDPKACFQMGMIYVLGINTAIDFKKAKMQFSSQSLLDERSAQRMLGFLSELDGDYSSAFMSYAKAAGSAADDLATSYIEKVIQEREALCDWLNNWKLPTRVLNNVINAILKDYTKGGDKKKKACIEIAAICQDTASCITAAHILSEYGEYSDAMQWLQFGKVENNNPVYQKIERKLEEISRSINLSDVLEVIEIEESSLLSKIDITGIFAPAKKSLNDISASCSRLWRKEVVSMIEKFKNKWEKEEKDRIEEEENRRHAIKQEKKKRRDKRISIISFVLFIPMILACIFADMSIGERIVGFIMFALLPMLLVRWIVIKVVDFLVNLRNR